MAPPAPPDRADVALELIIDRTWDGIPLESDAHTLLTIDRHPQGLRVSVNAPFYDDPPPDALPGSTWALWNYEVVELFIAGPDETYIEIELGPHGHYLALALDGVRNIVRRDLPITVQTKGISDGRWHGSAVLPSGIIPVGPHRIAAFAIHGTGKNRTYLSCPPMPGETPNFHQPHRFSPQTLPLVSSN